jgi:hypothetical protein
VSATQFEQVTYNLGALLDSIELGSIGLPDLQRPFVWKNAKIRDLFDSMYSGFPVGYLLFWKNGLEGKSATIGIDQKQVVPSKLIVDGQQRLTSLYAVFKGVSVVREDYSRERIEIAFNPLEGQFEVADAAVRKNRAFLPNISVLWDTQSDLFEVVEEYLEKLKETREVADQEAKRIKKAFTKLYGLTNFPFTALELAASLTEEEVAEVFVRVNSAGKQLNQADFILTLMSVFWDAGRTELEDFCRGSIVPDHSAATPYNRFITPEPDQLLRVAVGVAFRRARLKYVYSLLRGKDLETEKFSDERREEQFERLKNAQARALNLQYWHDFFKAALTAGYRSGKLISSQNTLLYCYVFYLLGRTEYGVEEKELRRVIARWFFMASLTGRYTSSPESTMEFDLARLRDVREGEVFVQVLDKICDDTLAEDFWEINLPNDLATSASRSPSLFGYYASLSVLDADVLFSDQSVKDLLDPTMDAKKNAIERHHLFPKAYLATKGITRRRLTNQIANYALVEWKDNLKISAKAPTDYAPAYWELVPQSSRKSMHYWHALPDGWETMPYEEFLERRREMIARVIRDAYAVLSQKPGGDTGVPVPDVEQLVSDGEGVQIEFKSTLRVAMHTGQRDPRIELSALKTVAGFLNSRSGGTLLIGVADDGSPVGLGVDGFKDEDKMHLHFDNLIRSRLGPEFTLYIQPRFEDLNGDRVMVIECAPARSPVFVKEGNDELFFVRTGASTSQVKGQQAQQFIKQRY